MAGSFFDGQYKTKTLCVDQQIPYGNAHLARFCNCLIVQIDTRGVQTALLAFIASSQALI
jgi:hypothetical protein